MEYTVARWLRTICNINWAMTAVVIQKFIAACLCILSKCLILRTLITWQKRPSKLCRLWGAVRSGPLDFVVLTSLLFMKGVMSGLNEMYV